MRERLVVFDPDKLPTEPKARREALADVFGQFFTWARTGAISYTRALVEKEDARGGLGRIFREPYERAAGLPEKERLVAYDLVRAGVDTFAQQLLVLLTSQGTSLRVGSRHAVRFRLVMEVVEADTEEQAVVLEEPINRGGKKSFMDYWGRWLNRFGDSSSGSSTTAASSPPP